MNRLRALSIFVIVLSGLVLWAESGMCQDKQSNSFFERHDTAFVRAAGVVLFRLSDEAIRNVWQAARTGDDTAEARQALQEAAADLSSTRHMLDLLHVPNYVTGCRYLCIIPYLVMDRMSLRDSVGVELYDAFVYDGRSVYGLLSNLQLEDPAAVAAVKKVLNIGPGDVR